MKLYDSVAVYEWYTHAFSKEKLDDRAIEPGDIRFSMNDISRNFENIPAVDPEVIIKNLVDEFNKRATNTRIEIDKKELNCDMGYGITAIEFFAEILKDRFRSHIGHTQMFYCWEDEESEAADL